MTLIRRTFYLLIGLTFPAFWISHASGWGAFLYRPIQQLFATSASGWPSLISAGLLYLLLIFCFESLYRLLKQHRP
ncbi:hypothetical protein [Desulfobulbus alkaliphilus]|uniref:hypothetical protein n=1 Tax=Desulfobulbus alkaliphilus TaxID=869814 RepID=UPI0019657347|nr:hypothetical protein [Desulfobulbus alkaliphilus]MBM9536960.1 hypothetical protein [Desulfobulbus alkaliphilus]